MARVKSQSGGGSGRSGSKSKNRNAAGAKESFLTDYFNNFLRLPLPHNDDRAQAETKQSTTSAPVPCATEGCKKKRKLNCCNCMCFQCCLDLNTEQYCSGHASDRAKKAEEDRYIDIAEGNCKQRSRNNKFHHFEERFDNYGQTVVVFCLRDFLRTRKFSEEIFLMYEREDRQRKLLLRREQHREQLAGSSSGGGSSIGGVVDEWSRTMVREESYERVKSSVFQPVVAKGKSPWLEKYARNRLAAGGGGKSSERK